MVDRLGGILNSQVHSLFDVSCQGVFFKWLCDNRDSGDALSFDFCLPVDTPPRAGPSVAGADNGGVGLGSYFVPEFRLVIPVGSFLHYIVNIDTGAAFPEEFFNGAESFFRMGFASIYDVYQLFV